MPLSQFTSIVRVICGVLFACGCIFAPFAWIGIAIPVGHLVRPGGDAIAPGDLMVFVGGFVGASLGYFVWLNWLLFAIRGKFAWVSGAMMQMLSIIGHAAWILFVLGSRLSLSSPNPAPLEANPMFLWLIANIVIAGVLIVPFWSFETRNAEQSLAAESR